MYKLLFFFLLTGYSVCAQNDQFYLKVAEGNSISSLDNLAFNVDYECPFRLVQMRRTYLITLDQPMLLTDLKAEIDKYLRYEYLEVVPKDELFFTPNDLQASQYALSIINAQQAWDLNLNASNAIIAVIDDAIMLTHPDLAPSIWTNPNEIAGDGIDNDINGYVDDVNGWDFANNDNDPNPPSASLSHGTHVSGIASASTDNGTGIASIGMNAKILPIKIGLDANGSLTGGPIAVDYAIAMGVDVINMSWGGSLYSQLYQDLFDIAYMEDIVCVAAAGNASTSFPMYPASYNHVISVASTNELDQVSSFSNYGPTVDLAAPGSNIYSTLPTAAQYGNLSGTSMASPCVAGLVALMRDANPLATVDEVEACLISSCDPISGSLSTQIGAGRINAYEAMLCITEPTAVFTSDLTQVCPGNSISFYNYSAVVGTTFSWSFPGGVPATSTAQNPIINYPVGGQFNVTLTVTNGGNSQTVTIPNYVTISEPTAVISGLSNIISGGFGSVSVNFTGIPPYDMVISDGTTNYPITGIYSSPYVHLFNPTADTDYSILSFNDSQCVGTASGTATITVSTSVTTMCDTANIAFIKYLGTDINDMSRGVADFGQYGYLVFGNKEFSASNLRTYVCRLDQCGNILWENIYAPSQYGLPVAAHMEGNEIVLLSYHGPVYNNVRTTITRLDLNGNVLDARRIGGSNNTTYPRYMDQAQNGEFLIGSVTNSSPSIGGNDMHIVRTQSNGTIAWQRRLGTNNTEFLHNIYEDNLGNVVATGYMIEGSLRSGVMTKLSATGALLWSKKYNMGSGWTFIFDLIELNGAYYSVGRTNTGTYGGYDGFLMKTDLNGNIIWSKKVGNTGVETNGNLSVKNDTIYVIGNSNSGIPSTDITLLRFDQSGNMLDLASFGTPVNDRIGGAGKYISLSVEGDIVGVASGNAGVLGGYDIALFRFNSYSDICQPTTANVLSSNIALTAFNNPTTSQITTWSFIPVTIPVAPVISNQGFACSNTTPCSVIADFNMNSNYCYADSIDFVDLTTPVNSTHINYWDFGDNTSTGFVPVGDFTHYYATPGTYDVTLIAMDTTTWCSDTITQTITITANPSIDLADTLYGCIYDTLEINLIENCLSDMASIVWSPDSIIVGMNGNNPIISIPGPGYVIVTVIDNGITIIDSVYIGISVNCCSSLAIIDPPIVACLNDPITFTESSITNGPTSYDWSFLPDGNPLTWTGQTPPGVIYNTTGIKQIILTLTDDCGVNYDTLNLSIINPPIFDLGPDLYLCSDTILQLGDTLIDTWTYLWQPGTAVSDSIISDPTVIIISDQTISVTVTDPWTGCSTFDTLNIIVDSISVDSGADLLFCSDSSFQLGLMSEPNWEYLWTPGAVVSDPLISDPMINIVADESIILIVTDTLSGCSATDTVEVTIDLVTINLGPDLTFCLDTMIVLGPAPIPGYDYSWEPAGSITDPTIANPIYLASGTETISVVVTSSISGCSASDTVIYSIDSVFVDILLEDTVLCSPSTFAVQVDHSGYSNIIWQPSANVVNQNVNSADMNFTENTVVYATSFSSTGACTDTDSMFVSFETIPPSITIDSLLCEDETFVYSPAGTWSDGSQIIGVISLNQEGIYTYSEDHVCGTTIHEITIDITSCDCNVYIPNAFTPDGNQFNNSFSIVSDCTFQDFHLTIYNRWGELIFESFDGNQNWDGTYNGKLVQDGTYTWKLSYIDTIREVPADLVGHVIVLR